MNKEYFLSTLVEPCHKCLFLFTWTRNTFSNDIHHLVSMEIGKGLNKLLRDERFSGSSKDSLKQI